MCLTQRLLPWLSLLLLVAGCNQKPRFERLTPAETGIDFANTIVEDDSLNVLDFEYIFNGGGVAVGDVNNDGLPDVFFSGSQVPNRLYLNRSDGSKIRFEDVTKQTGLLTPHRWSTGVSLVDINADGLLDIYVCTINPKRGATGAANQFFINQGIGRDGLPHYRDLAPQLGLDDRGYSTQAAFFDYDRDGDLDMYLLTNALEGYNRNQPRGPVRDGSGKSTDRLYRNDQGRFRNVSQQAGITIEGWGLGVAVADINEDGWPDVYCANDFQSNDLLWINNQDGTFSNRLTDYMKHGSYNAMGLDIADLNNDGHPELMTLDMMPDDNRRQKSMFGPHNPDRYQMGLDRGYAPQFVRNALQLNRGLVRGRDGRMQISFSEVGQLSGVAATDWSWSTLMADFDNDGLRDIFITNGYPRDITDLDFVAYSSQSQSTYFASDAKTDNKTKEKLTELIGVKKSNFMYHNRGDMAFDDVTEAWGLSIPSFSNGAAYADLDNDGDLDIITNNINGTAFVYRNRTDERSAKAEANKASGHYLRVNLVGEPGNPAGFGATVAVHYAGPNNTRQRQISEQSPYRGYVSTVESTVHFGLGAVDRVDTVLVRWLDGRTSRLVNLPANQVVTVRQREARVDPPPSAHPVEPLFVELTANNPIPFVQRENPFVDFKQQVLLPHLYSRNGPGMAVGDADGNGLDDVYVGGAALMNKAFFYQMTPGTFTQKPLMVGQRRNLADEMGSLLFDADGDGDLDLYVVCGGNEWLPNDPRYQDRLYRNDGPRGHGRGADGLPLFRADSAALPDTRASGSCVVAADYDRDGDLDLFVGGRVTPHSYPLPPRSYLLRNDSGPGTGVKFTDVTDRVAPGLSGIGMVTSALWSDFDTDGQIDLVVAGEFMPICFIKNQAGKLKVSPTNLPAGWWNSLTAGDFDNDGDIDYVAGNMGVNSRFKASAAQPISVYAKDYDQNGTLDPVMCQYIQGKCYPAHPRDQLAEQVPSLKKRFTSYAQYGEMTFDQLLRPDDMHGVYVATATEFSSSYIENQGKAGFRIRPLPMMAQAAPVFGMLTDDYDNDGNLDLLLIGNSYATDVQVGRYDAGKGLLLRGNGRGGFSAQTLARSGLCADRDAKSLVCVSTGPGQSLLLVGNNSDTLQTFQPTTRTARQITLRPDEYAATWQKADGRTHRAEVYTGSGYLAQSSRVLTVGQHPRDVTVLTYKGQRRRIVVR
ncbi:VCBS repeat-containing protein [Fibrella aquatilis]|uniref:VCBS repeat-containing protein n=1 Tax=Fibrella aquatilis TaxID=2817059 RepID=A0A939G4U8_9BACT|nr:VCBS repeat-containing protein [Fibrella aquatilis]MBO0931921.1 VCBS repeat-containing protein [Fibrella aquatilis]